MATCGIIDVGSNTIRLSIYQCSETDFHLLLNKKVTAGLAGYVREGVLSPEGIQTAARTLAGFRAILDNLNISKRYAFATASLRNVSNTEEAIEQIHAVSGLPVTLITGEEEAQLSFQGAVWKTPVDSGLLTDIGGGSVELVRYEKGEILSGKSLPIGSLSLYTEFVSGILPTQPEIKAIHRRIRNELERAGIQKGEFCCTHLRGVGGSVRAIGKLCRKQKGGESRNLFSKQDLKALDHQLRQGDKKALSAILRTAPDRVHTLLPGLAILRTIMKWYGVEQLDVSNQGVREGFLLRYVMQQEIQQETQQEAAHVSSDEP